MKRQTIESYVLIATVLTLICLPSSWAQTPTPNGAQNAAQRFHYPPGFYPRGQVSNASSIPSPASTASTDGATLDRAEQNMRLGDYAKAYCQIKPLADQGNPQAQFNIGWMYANGYGLRINETIALSWWLKAAEQNHPDAMHNVALAYLDGEGTEKDREQGYDWLLRASKHGDDDALPILLTAMQRGDKRAGERISQLLRDDSALFTQRRWVKVARANIRKTGNKHGKLIATLHKGRPLALLSTSGNWGQYGLLGDGRIGWIYRPLISDTPVSAAAKTPEEQK